MNYREAREIMTQTGYARYDVEMATDELATIAAILENDENRVYHVYAEKIYRLREQIFAISDEMECIKDDLLEIRKAFQ